jgi:hypothetical protein
VRRRLLKIAAAMSLLLWLVVSILWLRSYSGAYEFDFHRESWPQAGVWRTRGLKATLLLGATGS